MRENDSSSIAVRTERYRRGYSTPSHLREVIKTAHQTVLWRGVLAALADQAVAIGACIVTAWLLVEQPIVGAILAPVAAALAARQFRALECLVHEGSHFNWSRKNRLLNDIMTIALAALPTGAQLSGYRESHLRHHGTFGTDTDPDRERYRELDIESMDRTNVGAYVKQLLLRLPAYQRTWWRDSLQASPVVALLPLAWCAAFIALPALAIGGAPLALAAAAVWLLAFAVALPILRFIAEASEHVYSEATTVFDATVSNLGRLQRGLIHPHNDGYHTVHHMWPGVPFHRLAWLHRRLMDADPEYAARLRWRSGVFTTPVRGMRA